MSLNKHPQPPLISPFLNKHPGAVFATQRYLSCLACALSRHDLRRSACHDPVAVISWGPIFLECLRLLVPCDEARRRGLLAECHASVTD